MSEPAWWIEALEHERADRLDEAERIIHEAMYPNLPFPQQTAELYRLRVVRLLQSDRLTEAAEARGKAIKWIDFNTACATSGGEAMALMDVAEQFKRTLPQIPTS